jgi:hypothetical protein
VEAWLWELEWFAQYHSHPLFWVHHLAGGIWDGMDPKCENLGGTAYVPSTPAHIGGTGGSTLPVQTTSTGWSSASVCWSSDALTGLTMLPGGATQTGGAGCGGPGSPGVVSCPAEVPIITGVCMVNGGPFNGTRQFGIICGSVDP